MTSTRGALSLFRSVDRSASTIAFESGVQILTVNAAKIGKECEPALYGFGRGEKPCHCEEDLAQRKPV